MRLYSDKLVNSLKIDNSYDFNYLNNLYNASIDFKSKRDFENITEMFAELKNEGLKSSRIAISKEVRQDWFEDLVNPETNETSQTTPKNTKCADQTTSDERNIKEYPKSALAPLSKSSCIRYQVEYVKVAIKDLMDFYNSNDNKSEDSLYFHLCDTFPDYDCLDERLLKILKWFVICSDPSDFSFSKSFIVLKQFFSESVDKIIDDHLLNTDSLKILSLYGQLIHYMLVQESRYYATDTFPCMATLIAVCLYHRKSVREGFNLVKQGLNVRVPSESALAHHFFAVFSMDLGNLQLAYDVYLSWLNQQLIGNIVQYKSRPYASNSKENEYRKTSEGSIFLALTYRNLGYLCARISNTYELSSKQEEFFYGQSIEYKKKFNELQHDHWYSYVSYGQALRRDLHYNLNSDQEIQNHVDMLTHSLTLFEKGLACLPSNSDYSSLFAYRQYCRAVMELIMFEVCKTQTVQLDNQALRGYYRLLTDLTKDYKKINVDSQFNNSDLEDELRFRNDLLPVLHFYGHRTIANLEKMIHILLLSIRQNTTIMEGFLQRREYISTNYRRRIGREEQERSETRQIAYYTTLKNFRYIFDELYLENNAKLPKIDKDKKENNTKNCLTVMNAKYMNDPNEGVVLLTELTRKLKNNNLFSGKSAVEFNKSIFNEYLVFLKSFTEQIDKLTMWNRYANDYDDEGKNSNGCCVFVSPECFVNNAKYSSSGREITDRNEDDFRLYRVVYLSSDGAITADRNQGLNPNVYMLYKNLQELMEQLNNCLNAYDVKFPDMSEELNKIVEKSLSESLRKIIFLFKYEDYSDEQESRLILFRDKDHQEDIRLIDGEFPKLAINPFFQIFVKGIMFGPNVRNPEKWEPYFQYQLNEMWKKDSSSSEKEDPSKKKFFIKQSSIKYLT